MSFNMPKAARGHFRTVTERTLPGARYIMFDTYYICLLLGLDARRLGPAEELEGDRFIENYPEDYKAQADYIAGLLIDAELERNRIDLSSKGGVEALMVELLDPSSPTGLSAVGSDRLNRYAVGGFARIEEEMPSPARLEDLLVRYATIWGDLGDDD